MRLYNRNIMRKRVKEIKRWTTPDRDAVVWSVDTGNFYALVKIQGSNTTIKAHYPRNWKVTPTWLKAGNAVRIRHRAGAQGYIEVIGHGRAIPTPVEGDSLPPDTGLTDGIVSGMNILQYDGGGMNVTVSDGVFRIDNELYVFTAPVTGYVVMDDPAPMTMGNALIMGWGDTITPVVIAAAPSAGYGRYDALVIAADGTIDVITGGVTGLSTEPSKPSVPTDHILIGYLFIYGGMTSIPQNAIGVEWTAPYGNTVTPSSTMLQANGTFEMEWSGVEDTPVGSFSLSITDQYGNARAISVTATCTMLIGSGGVGTAGGGPFTSSAAKTCGSAVTFFYERNQLASPEISPVIQVDFAGYGGLTYLFPLILLDVGGDPV
jgi:hypothetical protein